MLDSMFESVFQSVSESISESASESAFNLVVGEVGGSAMHLAIVSSVLLKLTSRLVRTVLLTKSHSLNMVVASYPNSHSF